jgi:hypothetical protein
MGEKEGRKEVHPVAKENLFPAVVGATDTIDKARFF